MANLSQEKRQRMLGFLEEIKKKNQDENIRIAINEIENELTEKKYGLIWEKHEENVDVQIRTNVPVFTEVKEKEIIGIPNSKNFNFLLEGDNLHSLKLLEKTHKGKVDVIYIDPPYNTGGKDFIYDDNYIESLDGFRHSKWLSFMSERLKIASKLLTSDGVLVISIGYHEVNNLMLLCEEIFSNKQITCVTVQTSGGKPNGGFTFVQEYLVYITPESFMPNSMSFTGGKERSPFEGLTLSTFDKTTRPNQTYPIFIDNKTMKIVGVGKSLTERINDGDYIGEKSDFIFDYSEAPEGTTAIFPYSSKGEECVWRLIPSRLLSDWKKGYIKVGKNNYKDNPNKYSVQYLPDGVIKKIESGELKVIGTEPYMPTLVFGENQTVGDDIPTIWTEKNFHTTKGSSLIKEMFNEKKFPYPKPLDFIVEVIRGVSNNNDTILDFFAGSGTTAHAVIKLNEIDNKNRRFILCTNNENNICDNVTYERIRKVIQGYDFKGEKQVALYEKKLTIKDLKNGEKIVSEVEQIEKANSKKYFKVKTSFKDGILKVFAIEKIGDMVKGIPSNLKYYKTDYIPKVSDDEFYIVGEELTKHIKEMVQLEHGISLDSDEYILLLTENDADELEKNQEKLSMCKEIYISSSVFLTSEQKRLFSGIVMKKIPDYYFEEELKEVGEL